MIRPLRVEDAEAMADLHLDCWDDAYTGLVPQQVIDARRAKRDERVAMWSANPGEGVPTWVAEQDDGLVGFVSAGPARDDDLVGVVELWALYARAAVWGTGVGHTLLDQAIGDAPAYLWVLAGNDRAIGFYERHTFTFDGRDEPTAEGLHLRMVRP